MVLTVALLLVSGIGFGLNALTGGSDESKQKASNVSAKPPPSAQPSDRGSSAPSKTKKNRKKPSASPTPTLAEPEGVCEPSDITVSPFVYRAIAWRHSYVVLELKTKESRACTWHTSPDTVTVRITNSVDQVWTSSECPLSVPTKDLVLRNDVGVKVSVVWSGRRSDSACTRTTRWAPPGWYRVEAAAFAGEPGQLLFELRKPEDVPASSSSAGADGASGLSSNVAPGQTTPTEATTDTSGAPEPSR